MTYSGESFMLFTDPKPEPEKDILVQQEESVGAVFVRRSSQTSKKTVLFLLLQSFRGDWNFPKGHREGVETDMETLDREIQEETGITKYSVWDKLGSIQYLFSKNNDPRSKERYAAYHRPVVVISKRVIFYLAITKESKVKISKEHKKYGWFDIEETMRRIKWNKPLAKIVPRAYEAGLYRLLS